MSVIYSVLGIKDYFYLFSVLAIIPISYKDSTFAKAQKKIWEQGDVSTPKASWERKRA